MKTKLKRNKGITLISLIVTIIVLLILAGVAISMLSGENGILNQATRAKEETNIKSDLEKVQLAVASALTDGLGKIDIKDTIGDTEGSLYKALENDGITGYTGNGILEYNGNTYVVSEDGTVGIKKFTADNYGDLVNYNVDIDGDTTNADWQIFYDDGQNVYLIAKDYVEIDETTKTATGMSTEEYYTWWDEVPPYPSKTTDIVTKYEKFEGLLTNGYYNAKCVAQLLNKTSWTAYVDNQTADYAIGEPTLELFAKSYNEKYPSKTIEYSGEYEYGYKVKWDTDADYYGDALRGLETGDNLYVIESTEKCQQCWLASPDNFDQGSMLCVVTYDGFLSGEDYSSDYISGIRPIVCLKSAVEFEKVGEIWNIK